MSRAARDDHTLHAMSGFDVSILTGLILIIAVLYSSVGHAGASGYLAAMALIGMAPEEMKPTALILNIFVALIGAYRFGRAGHFHFRTFWPFAVAAIPMAFIGGRWHLPAHVFQPLIGAVLLFAALMLVQRAWSRKHEARSTDADIARSHTHTLPPVPVMLVIGTGLGLLAGLTGTGGGIFLSPLLILFYWADPKRTAGVSVVFVLVNSVAGIAGHMTGPADIPSEIPYYIMAAVLGGAIGSGIGASGRTEGNLIRMLLAVVLCIAAAKMFLTML